MGFWSGIKHALNSTLGTEEFQPLDKIILGSKGLVASDNFYTSLFGEGYKQLNQGESVDVLKVNWQGSIKMKIYAYVPSGSARSLRIYKNGIEQIASLSFPVASTDVERNVVLSNLKKNDIISFIVQSGGSLSVQSAEVYADVIDMSAIEIL